MSLGDLDRRRFLGIGMAAAAGLVVPAVPAMAGAGRALSFRNLHTGERLTATYWSGGRYLSDGCRQIDRLLRDHRTGDVAPISVELLDLLHDLHRRLDAAAPFEVISGYRSPRTNSRLAAASSGVARRSLHMRGMAVDVRLPGCSLKRLRTTARAMKAGGVGFYPRSGFVHLDVGRVRYW
ncbi:MAG: DUF882 domain-containing protein [Alphaproteobacteria bacterium]|nr:DUF882 domain-containing protein [Alphaproteobacteria bacterium]